MKANSGYGRFADYYDALNAFFNYKINALIYNTLISEYAPDKPDGGILLDLACGTGKMSVEMATLGWDVIGVDISPDMLSNATPHEKVTYICQDMTELDLYGTVDAAVSLLDGLNHLPDEAALQRAFKRVSLFMNPGGVFIFDMNTIHKHEVTLGDNILEVREIGDGEEGWRNCEGSKKVYMVWKNAYQGDGVVDIILDVFVENQDGLYERFTEEIRERAYETSTVCKLCEQAGFEVKKCLDFTTLEEIELKETKTPKEASHNHERIIFICQKVV